jgi:hypothetical protein
MNTMILKRIQTVLALLLVGSVSMLADGSDPFPEVPHAKYQANMTLTALVVLNGVTLTSEAIVAVYHDDQIRGKGRPNASNVLSITVDGDIDDEDIYFRVFTGGRIIEVDQGAQYTYYGKIGSADSPYLINLTTITTNTSAEGWATTCLPFNAAVPEGVTVYAAKSIEDGVMKLDPVSCTILPKDTPVLLKTETQTSYEWLSRVADGDATIETNLFKGTTEEIEVEAESVLTLGHGKINKAIGFWLFTGTTIPANRAYLEKPAEGVRGYTLDWTDEVTGIEAIDMNGDSANASPKSGDKQYARGYDLLGRSLTGKSHLMIINGKKIMVR